MITGIEGGMMHEARQRVLKDGPFGRGPVIYWMSRDQRVHDNWALLAAQSLAVKRKVPLLVVFCLVPAFLGAARRQYGFMLRGLKGVARSLEEYHIGFVLRVGEPPAVIPDIVSEVCAGALITDFDPLQIKKRWKEGVSKKIDIPFYEVDAHNVVPCWVASPKQEYAAYTFRPKLHRRLEAFLCEFPKLTRHPVQGEAPQEQIDWEGLPEKIKVDGAIKEVTWITPGEDAARTHLSNFCREGLAQYEKLRNDPTADGQSDLSPYLHFGQVSAQHVALEVKKAMVPAHAQEAFLEELLVRRELSDNFCHHSSSHDSLDVLPGWAQDTLRRHWDDSRTYTYEMSEFEQGQTHDELWNAAQQEMVLRGKMHGYMRMYWAKKILEWSTDPNEALKTAIYLNDRYELDGRDPNGYAGILWSIGGLHDRAWAERPVFGKIRYMSLGGARSKFDVDAYVDKIRSTK